MNKLPDWWTNNFGPKPYAIMDCLEGMKKIPDKAVDLVLTDPPYGIGEHYENYDDTNENLMALIKLFMPEILRISKRALITCGTKNIHSYPKPTWTLCWCVPAGTGRSPWGFCCWTPILAYGKDPALEDGRGSLPDTIVHTESSPHLEHPCPKPVGVWNWILERGSRRGEVVFDPFLGSGTTLLACRKTNRIGLGFEIEPKYEEVIKRRYMADTPDIETFGASDSIG